MTKNFYFALWLVFGLVFSPNSSHAEYDPLRVKEEAKLESIELTVKDSARDREIPLRVYLPSQIEKAPVILFSHGLGGSKENGKYLANHWSKRGYVAVFMQHPGSDESVWKEARPLARFSTLKEAASGKNLFLRCEDVKKVIDALEEWNKESQHKLSGRLDLEHIGMCGHSFGAYTTQGVSGQSFPLIRQKYTDPRIDAACAFSPAAPAVRGKGDAFQSVKIPWMLMTGTEDSSPIGDQSPESRREVYPALTDSIDRYEIVLFEGTHGAFGDGERLNAANKNPNHHRVIKGLSTAFWDAYLKEDSSAKSWLTGDGAKQIVEAKDVWHFKLKK